MKRLLPVLLSAGFLIACTASDGRGVAKVERPSADGAASAATSGPVPAPTRPALGVAGDAGIDAAARDSVPRILQLPRPTGGEWFGLYIMGKKAGYAFTDLRAGTWEGEKAVVLTSHVTLKVAVGGVNVQREMREERFYAYADGGRLIAFRVEKRGDGGDEVLLGRCSAKGIDLLRQRPGRPDERRVLAPTRELVEHADAPRLAASTRAKVEGAMIDLEGSLTDKATVSEFIGESELQVAGISVPVLRVRTTQEGLALGTVNTIAVDGRVLEFELGQVVAKAEDEKIAQRLDKVDLFNLTRVTLDKRISAEARGNAAQITFLLSGLPKELRRDSYRQRFTDAPGGATRLTITARPPSERRPRPVAAAEDSGLAEALRSSLAVESEAPAIVVAAKQVVGAETDAWTAVQRLNRFVYGNLEKAYGSSSDRATDVLAARRGDCTEHSLLLTALARASGIPARRIDGLVYVEGADGIPALYWHEWVEVFVGEWVAVDPTFNQPVADATHIAFGEEGRSDTAGLLGRLDVKVLDSKPLPVPAAKASGGER